MATAGEWSEQVRAIGPARWAESATGWIGLDDKPIVLADWQRAVLTAWWAHRDDITTLAISNVKKTGKTFLSAIMLAWRFLALPGEHFSCGNDMEQSAARQFGEIASMIKRHPVLSDQIKVTGKTLTFGATGSTLAALAVDATGNAGANHLTASHTEAWGIMSELACRAYEELTPPPGKFYGLPALRVLDSYAGYIGESDEVWHSIVDRGLAGDLVSDDWPIYRQGRLMLFHMEGENAQARCYRADDNPAGYYDEQKASLRPNTFSRLHLNRRQQDEGDFVDLDVWQALENPFLSPLRPGSSRPLYIGLDLAVSPTGDDAALVGLYERGGELAVGLHKVWRGRDHPGEYLNLYSTVRPFLWRLGYDYNIAAICLDPWQGIALGQEFQAKGAPVVFCPQNATGRGSSDTVLYSLISHKQIAYYPDSDLKQATINASAKEIGGDGRIYIKKKHRQKKVDLLVAFSIALYGHMNEPIQIEWKHERKKIGV